MGLETLVIATFILSAATTAYQVIQAKKMKQKALAAADARKGFEIVVEGETGYPPIIYGRALVGGMRLWHGTSSKYIATATNADKSFLTGDAGSQGYTYNFTRFAQNGAGPDIYNTEAATANVLATPSGYLSSSMEGTRNEFMFYQQVLCAGPINKVIEPIIDSRFIDDPSLGSYGRIEKTPSEKAHNGVKAALRLDYHYKGSEADTIISTNFGERSSATFERLTYLSAVFRLDRDNPQFSGTPPVQQIVEGRLVRTVTGGVISSTEDYYVNPDGYIYSNNPAWCLLDYLLDPVWGRGLDLEELDLDSFESAAAICGQIVQTGVHVGGKTWRSTDGLVDEVRRDIPLYECNIMLDPAKPYRENTESLLSTMGDARLTWSQGKYRLRMQYPMSNEDIVLDDTLTDDELVHGETVTLDWPNTETKYNHVIVKFHNEFEQFVEDSVSWPPKYDGTYVVGIGANRKPSGIGSWDDSRVGGRLLNAYAVWEGTGNSTNLTYQLKVDPADQGSYTLTHTGDNTSSVSITDVTGGGSTVVLPTNSHSDPRTVATATVNLGDAMETKIYELVITGTNTNPSDKDGDYKGVAASLVLGSKILWTTRSTSYDDFITKTTSSAVYDAMLAEDNGFKLETTVFAEGITDPYHALAKAEELCRISRSALKATLPVIVTDKFHEPGDYLQVASETLELGLLSDLFVRVDSAKAVREDRAEIEVTRFDYSQLAWAMKDDVYIGAPPVIGYFLPQPEEILYAEPDVNVNFDSSGILTCSPVSHPDLAGYIWYVHRAGVDPVDELGKPIFTEVGRTLEPTFTLDRVEAASAFFGVKIFATNGKTSLMTTTDPLVAILLTHLWTRQVVLQTSSDVFQVDDEPIRFEAVIWAMVDVTYQWFVDDTIQSGWTDDYFYLEKFSDTNQKAVRVAVIDNGSGKTYEDVIDVGYIAPGDTEGILETYYLRQYEPPNAPESYPPTDDWVTALPEFGNVTRWQTTVRVKGGVTVSPYTTPAKLDSWIFRGPYDPLEEYFIDHVVTFNNGTYIGLLDYTTGEEPSGTDQDTAFWRVVNGQNVGGDPNPLDPATVLNINIPASSTTVNLRTLADAAGFDNATPYEINYTVVGDVYGNPGKATAKDGTSGGTGIDTGTWPTNAILTLTLTVPSGKTVSGGGGGGGRGDIVPGNGGNGGDGLLCQVDIDVVNEGTIQGGGFGGAGGQMSGYNANPPYVPLRGGGGGGGGAPLGEGGGSTTPTGGIAGVSGNNATLTVLGAGGPGYGDVVGTDHFDASGGSPGGEPGDIPPVTPGPTYQAYRGSFVAPEEDYTLTWASRGWREPLGGFAGAAGYAIRQNGNTVGLSGAGTELGTVG